MPKIHTSHRAASEGVALGPHDRDQNGYFHQRLIKSQQHKAVNLTTVNHSSSPFILHTFTKYVIPLFLPMQD